MIEKLAQSQYQIAAQVLRIKPLRLRVGPPAIDAPQPLGAVVENVLVILPVGHRRCRLYPLVPVLFELAEDALEIIERPECLAHLDDAVPARSDPVLEAI